jgi:hypothetical protein
MNVPSPENTTGIPSTTATITSMKSSAGFRHAPSA